jgi:hypothetical protein
MPREGLDTGRAVSVIERLKPIKDAVDCGGSHQIVFCKKVPAPPLAPALGPIEASPREHRLSSLNVA